MTKTNTLKGLALGLALGVSAVALSAGAIAADAPNAANPAEAWKAHHAQQIQMWQDYNAKMQAQWATVMQERNERLQKAWTARQEAYEAYMEVEQEAMRNAATGQPFGPYPVTERGMVSKTLKADAEKRQKAFEAFMKAEQEAQLARIETPQTRMMREAAEKQVEAFKAARPAAPARAERPAFDKEAWIKENEARRAKMQAEAEAFRKQAEKFQPAHFQPFGAPKAEDIEAFMKAQQEQAEKHRKAMEEFFANQRKAYEQRFQTPASPKA